MTMRGLMSLFATLAALTLGRPAAAEALTYNFWLNAPERYPVTHLVMYARGAGQDDVFLSPVTLQPSGTFQLTHQVGFDAEQALVLGITERDKDDRWDIVMFTNGAFATSSLNRSYSEVFSASSPGYLSHGVLPVKMQEAHAGDAVSLEAVTAFLRGTPTDAYFDPHAGFSIIQFSIVQPPIGGVPEPVTLALIGLGLVGIGHRQRRRAERTTSAEAA